MAFSRNSMAAAVAGTLSLAVLTGCPAPVAPVVSPTPGATPTAPGATATPGTTPTAPGATATPGDGTPTAAPSTTPSASPLVATTVQGKVYDETGALVNTGAKVMIKSLNPSNPFETTVDVVNGNYVANNVPSGVLVEITAMRDGYTNRTKVENLLPLASVTAGGNQVNFGGTIGSSTNEDPYFISKFPEVTSTEPVDEADLADPTQLTYKLTLSEALDATNQRRFAQALRIWPANSAAVADGTASYVSTATGGAVTPAAGVAAATDLTIDAGTVTPGNTSYVVQEGVSFNTDSNLATVTWDAAGKVATLSFRAPLKSSSASKAIYAVGLVSGGTTERIVDASGDQLGLNAQGPNAAGTGALTGTSSQTAYAGAGLIADVFRKATLPTLSAPSVAAVNDSIERWAATHNSVSRFNVAEDDTAPVLQSATVTGGNVISLTFSEPLVAFGGNGVYLTNGALDETQYTIRLAEKLDDLASEKLDTSLVTDPTTAPTSTASTRLAALELNKNYVLTSTEFDIKVSETDPKVLLIRRNDFINNAGDKFRVTAKAVKVRVSTSVKDPAGNAVQSSNDANLKATNI